MPVRLLIGTRKGAFLYRSDEARRQWSLSAPILPGWSLYHLAADTRRSPTRLYAAGGHWAWGPVVARSDDGGTTWDWNSPGLRFAEDMGLAMLYAWHVRPAGPSQPGVVYAGTQPAGLFRSADWGESWTAIDTLNRHPERKFWTGTGGGESCIHSVEVDPRDPDRVYAAVAAGGTYVTGDGGATWRNCSHRAIAVTKEARAFIKQIMEQFPADLPPDMDPYAASEMHKFRIDPAKPNRLWGQAHIGVFRSDDRGETWADVTEGLPSFHGFPIGVSKNGTGAAYVVPLATGADNFRVCNGQFAVYRTRDDGTTWERLTEGLPGPGDYQSVYREAMDTDGQTPEGVYVGTTNGQLYASVDGGDHWTRLPGTLPPILSVTAVAS